MPNWDEDSPRLRDNLRRTLAEISLAAEQRTIPTLAAARRWQASTIKGLSVANPQFIGAFRGEPGLETTQVRVGMHYGVHPAHVGQELTRFEAKLQTIVAELDRLLPSGAQADADQLAAIIDVCAWAHAEWVRMHPFANGNGRTPRLWANSLAMRYGLPPFVRLRPRPDRGYGLAGEKAMLGKWKPTAIVFRRLLSEFLGLR